MATLTKKQILEAEDIKSERMTIPEWPDEQGQPGEINVRGATALEQDAYQESLFRPDIKSSKGELKPDYRNSKARLVVKCVVDDEGKRIFTDEDAEALGKKSGAVILRIFKVVRRLSGMDEESEKVLEKNSEQGPPDSSPSS